MCQLNEKELLLDKRYPTWVMKWIARSATWGCEIPIDLIYIITAFILLVIRRRRNKGHNYDSGRFARAQLLCLWWRGVGVRELESVNGVWLTYIWVLGCKILCRDLFGSQGHYSGNWVDISGENSGLQFHCRKLWILQRGQLLKTLTLIKPIKSNSSACYQYHPLQWVTNQYS